MVVKPAGSKLDRLDQLSARSAMPVFPQAHSSCRDELLESDHVDARIRARICNLGKTSKLVPGNKYDQIRLDVL